MEHTVMIRPFGTAPNGEAVSAICLDNGMLACEILTYGATIRTMMVHDKNGNPTDVVLGYDTVAEYAENGGYLGAVPGRYANRIARCHINLNEQEYTLTCNDGENHLHGGSVGFSHRVWAIEQCDRESVTLCLHSPDGDQGYPGNLEARVCYALEGSSLTIDYTACSDADTYCNLTNHSYFNLAGHDSGDILAQELTLHCTHFTPTDAASIPTGEIAPVEGTPMDFRAATAIGARVDEDYIQLTQAKGYDHNYVIDGAYGTLRPAAEAYCAATGIVLQVCTTQPGVQLYTGNYLENGTRGKGGSTFGFRHGLCLETQHFPDTPHHANFPSALLKAGEEYHETTTFSFSVE